MDITPGVFGLLGAFIGASASVATMLIQSKISDRRERLRLVKELAIHDAEKAFEVGKKSSDGFHMLPLVVYMHYYSKLLEAMEEGKLTPERAKELYDEAKLLAEALPRN